MTKISCHLVAGTFLAAFGTSMLYGVNLAIFNLPTEHVKSFLVIRYTNATVDTKTGLYTVATCMYLLGGIIGSLFSGAFADLLGRRNGLLVTNAILIVGCSLFFISYGTMTPELVYIGRLIVGLSNSVGQSLCYMYLTEIAPIKWRGVIGTTNNLATVIGLLVATILTLTQVLGNPVSYKNNWLIATGLIAVPACVQLATHWLLPDSPRYLYSKGRIEEAIDAEKKYDPDRNIDEFLAEMEADKKSQEEEGEFHFFDIFTWHFRREMVVACLFRVAYAFSAVFLRSSYSRIMLANAGFPDDTIQWCVIGLNILNILCVFISQPLLERFGRRPVFFYPTALCIVCMIGMGVAAQMYSQYMSQRDLASANVCSIVSIVLLFLHTPGASVGVSNIAPLIVSETFRQVPRGAAYTVTQAVQWCSLMVVMLAYPNIEVKAKGISFYIFLAVLVPIFILYIFIMPETKGRLVDDIVVEMDHATFSCCKPGSSKVETEDHNPHEMESLHAKA